MNEPSHIWALLIDLSLVHGDLEAMDAAFGEDVYYSQLVKIYGPAPEGQRRYSPAQFVKSVKTCCTGNPDMRRVSTSYAERANLSIPMGNRRMTRLTNAFSQKIENHVYATAIYFVHYNFVRIHQTLRVHARHGGWRHGQALELGRHGRSVREALPN